MLEYFENGSTCFMSNQVHKLLSILNDDYDYDQKKYSKNLTNRISGLIFKKKFIFDQKKPKGKLKKIL
jgi:hypothetical protein